MRFDPSGRFQMRDSDADSKRDEFELSDEFAELAEQLEDDAAYLARLYPADVRILSGTGARSDGEYANSVHYSGGNPAPE